MAFSQKQLREVFGSFSFVDDPDERGAIIIDSRWVGANIVNVETAFGRFPCHKKVVTQIAGFISNGSAKGLINDIGGVWVPRHVLWNPAKPLSGHAFGCDVDINVDDGKDGPGKLLNYGDNSYQPSELLRIARRWGFEWGGAWRSVKDGMHFSCVKIGAKPDMGGGEHAGSHGVSHTAVAQTVLKIGDRGEPVKILQRLLNGENLIGAGHASAGLVVDGIFGKKTKAALKDFQRRERIAVDGIAGPETWAAFAR